MAKERIEDGSHLVAIDLPGRTYEVRIGDGILDQTGRWVAGAGLPAGARFALISDDHVAPLYGERVAASLKAAGFDGSIFTVPAGESSKGLTTFTSLCEQLSAAGFDRSSFVVALGGGVIGDLAGFVAAAFYRGIPMVQIPTTVVSLVDSSVGGKTGVNLPQGKNLVGAFHQPRLVLADVSTLKSLPGREYREGFAEIIKHAVIRDGAMLDEVIRFRDSPKGIAPLIARNVLLKAGVVEADERETSGLRALLNFGHTIGHGIEAAAGYGEWLHGEAVSLGMVAALRLSEEKAGLDPAVSRKVMAALEAFELPLHLPPGSDAKRILAALARDKKFTGGSIRFVLARALGEAFVSTDVTWKDLEAQVERLILV